MPPPAPHDLLDDLKFRGQVHQSTDEAALRRHLSTPRKVYCGFDPTADSLTIGNLVSIMGLRRFQIAGHTPVVVMGGGTGMIGDPSGKSAERQLQTLETVAANVRSQERIFRALLSFEGPNAAVVVNNADWLGRLNYIELLRDIGKHFSVNEMVKRDSVRDRLTREQGISYTEFSYVILQAYDYLHLFKEMGVTVQIGGSDQWGNIVSGGDLIRRLLPEILDRRHQHLDTLQEPHRSAFFLEQIKPLEDADATGSVSHALTWPLITKADGTKFGKTESGAVWLTRERTSPYAFYQFWLNAADADVMKFMKTFTLLPRAEIEALEAAHAADPGKREAHRALARHMTEMLHGRADLERAEAAAGALFSGDVASLDLETLNEVFASVPSSTHSRSELVGEGLPMADVLAMTTLAKSKREAREHLSSGAVTLNGERVGETDRLTAARLLHGSLAVLRRGKKAWHVTRWG
ncbi:MAG: tyrosine--tRNA ligase [Phycisphaerales bacterium]